MNKQANKAEPAGKLIFEHQLEDRFNDFLNEVNGVVTICGYNYDPAQALKEVDPTAYHQEFLNWLDAEMSAGRYEEIDGEYYEVE